MKKRLLGFIISLLTINLISAYIDPGTGGYLATSLWSTILTYLAIFTTIITAFLTTYFINPIKNSINKIFKNKKMPLILFFIIILIIFFVYSFNKETPEFNPELSGTHNYQPHKTFSGYNLYEGKLMDNYGNIIHNWSSIYMGVLDSNGDYYAQKCYECPKWGRYKFTGEPIWEKDFPIHHNILLTNTSVFVMGKEVQKYNGRKVEFDNILEYNKKGELIQEYSLYDNLDYLKQFHNPLELESSKNIFIPEEHRKNKSIWGGNYDYYHLNYVSIVPELPKEIQEIHKAFTKGNWIISFRHGSLIFILDKDTKEVLWYSTQFSLPNEIQGQHSPQMLKNGNLLIFDNGRYREWSRIIALNPITMKVEWQYPNEKNKDFFTLSQGHVQLLPNNNLLITETEKGRVFEITPYKELVWEFYHPEKQNSSNSQHPESYGKRQEISKMERYNKNFIDSLMKKYNL